MALVRTLNADDARALQIYLNRLGEVTTVDGIPGPITLGKFKLVLKRLGLPESDDLTPEIMARIAAAVLVGIQPPLVPGTPEHTDLAAWQPVLHLPLPSGRRLHPDHGPELVKKMKDLFGLKFKEAVDQKKANTIKAMSGVAHAAMKVREKSNRNDGTEVNHIQYTAFGNTGDAWCMFQDQTDIAISEALTGIQSMYPRTGSCASARERMPSANIIKDIKLLKAGNSIIYVHPDGSGHVGEFQSWIKEFTAMACTEGNTTQGMLNDIVVREGGGSYETERPINPSNMKIAMLANAFPGAL